MQGCPLCRAGGDTIHENAHELLHEAIRVVAMHKAQREAYYQRVLAKEGEVVARDLVAVVNNVRAANRRMGV